LNPGRSIQRRLAAVAFADVADFSKLMESDDTQTILTWRALRENLLEPKIAEHGGHLLQVMGDGLFIEFESAVSALVGTCVRQWTFTSNTTAPT
jgi:adenylate cyclase